MSIPEHLLREIAKWTDEEWVQNETPFFLNTELYRDWAKTPYWTLTETQFLLLGLRPGKGLFNLSHDTKTPWGRKINEIGEIIDRACALKDFPCDTISKFDEDRRELVYEIVCRPPKALRWARKQGLDVPQEFWDMVMAIGDTPEGQEEVTSETNGSETDCEPVEMDGFKDFVEQFAGQRRRGNPGSIESHEADNRAKACAVWYMQKMALDRGCRCRHDKLANIAFDFATDEDGLLLKDRMKDRVDARKKLYGMIKREAMPLVPLERQLWRGNSAYQNSQCVCPIDWHREYDVKRQGFSKPVRQKAKR